MNHAFSTTSEFQPKQMYSEMVYSRPNTMIGFMWKTIVEEALCSFLRETAQLRSQERGEKKAYAYVEPLQGYILHSTKSVCLGKSPS